MMSRDINLIKSRSSFLISLISVIREGRKTSRTIQDTGFKTYTHKKTIIGLSKEKKGYCFLRRDMFFICLPLEIRLAWVPEDFSRVRLNILLLRPDAAA